MASKLQLLIDLNVILDVLQKREPFYADSAAIIDMVANKNATGFLAAHSITTLFYILRKTHDAQTAHALISQLLRFFTIAPANQAVIHEALQLGWKDFEDAVQMITAVHVEASYLLTGNPKDFQTKLVPVLTPTQFLRIHQDRLPNE